MHPFFSVRGGGRWTGRPLVWFALLVLLLAWGFLLPSAAPTASAQTPSPTFDLSQVNPPVTLPRAVQGQNLYAQNCAPCHGPTGGGDGPTAAQLPDPATIFADPEAAWDRTPAEWFHTVKFGRLEKLMPPWQNQMSETEMWNTVYYAWQLHTNQLNLINGQVLYAEQCAACHGPTGAGDGPEAPADLLNLADVRYAMSVSQADWWAGWESAHPELGAEWSQIQQRNVLEYIRSFNYLPTWSPLFRAGSGVFRGQVVAGSAEEMDLAGVDIELDAFLGFEPIANFTTTLAADGTFTFTGLDQTPEIVYMASAYYGEIGYSSQPLNFGPGGQELTSSMTIYATTADPSGVRLNRMHWIIDSQPGFLIVGQVATFGMDGDRTFVGAPVAGVTNPATVALHVPAGAQEISFQNGLLGDRFQQVGNRIYDTAPVAPGVGTRQIIMRYVIPYAGAQATVDQELFYITDDFTLLVAELPNLQVDVPGLEFGGAQALQTQSYLLWQGLDMAPRRFNVSINGLLPPGTVDPRALSSGQTGGSTEGAVGASGAGLAGVDQPLDRWAILVSAALVALALAALLIWSRQRGGQVARESVQDLRQERNTLVGQIARLDDLHNLGELDTRSWERQRSQLKAQLLKIAAQIAEQQGEDPLGRG